MALSEAIMVYWTNFIRTGNPNEHHRQDSVLPASKERNRFRSVVWDEYDSLHQKYLEIGMSLEHTQIHSMWMQIHHEIDIIHFINTFWCVIFILCSKPQPQHWMGY